MILTLLLKRNLNSVRTYDFNDFLAEYYGITH